jgi:hypothetical protein
MTDPLRPLDKPTPRRAEPIQPDRPGRGADAETPSDSPDHKDSVERAVQQENAALDNVRST